MRKTILMLLLAIVSNNAEAAWVEVGGNKTTTTYADPATIRKNGNLVKMWDMYDYTTVQVVDGDKFMSQKSRKEYDCKEEQLRILAYSSYSENMGKGDVVYFNDSILNWQPVSPGSIGETLWKVACGVK